MNVYAWSEYFPPSVIDKFQKETGLHVNYSVFDSPDAAETALSVGHSNYDIVTMNASPHLAREIPKGFWMKLDPSKIPNAANSDPRILKILGQVDPGNRFAVPWMWGTVGILYNADKARAILGDTPITQSRRRPQQGDRREVREMRHQRTRQLAGHHAPGGPLSGPAAALR